MKRLAVVALFASLVLACAKETTVWEADRCRIGQPPTLQLASGETPQWVGCRAMYATEVAGIPATLFLQFITAGTSGSFVDPAPGWLSVTVTGIDEASGTLGVVPSTASSSVPAAEVYYAPLPNSEGEPGTGGKMTSGSLVIRSVDFDPDGDPKSSTFNFEAEIAAATADEGAIARGGFAVFAPEPEDADSQSPGPVTEGPACSSTECDRWSLQCNGTTQAPCYCASACLCYCSGDNACALSNAKSARDLGTDCPYPKQP